MNIYLSVKTKLNQEIACIAWAIDEEAPQILIRAKNRTERKLLQQFQAQLNKQLANLSVKWIGHHINLMLRILYQRLVAQKIAPSIKLPIVTSSWPRNVCDTGKLWAGKSNIISLNALCEILNIPRNETAKECETKYGLDVGAYFIKNDLDAVIAGSNDNVASCRLVFKRLTFQEPVVSSSPLKINALSKTPKSKGRK